MWFCLCAQWCGTCREYAQTFDQLKAALPGHRYRWIDIEDEADVIGEVDVETFPTLLVAQQGWCCLRGLYCLVWPTRSVCWRRRWSDGIQATIGRSAACQTISFGLHGVGPPRCEGSEHHREVGVSVFGLGAGQVPALNPVNEFFRWHGLGDEIALGFVAMQVGE